MSGRRPGRRGPAGRGRRTPRPAASLLRAGAGAAPAPAASTRGAGLRWRPLSAVPAASLPTAAQASEAAEAAAGAVAASAWPWAFALLALVAVFTVGALAWRLGRLQGTATPAAAAGPSTASAEAGPVALSALAACVELCPGPALLLLRQGAAAPTLQALNAAARVWWPAARLEEPAQLALARPASGTGAPAQAALAAADQAASLALKASGEHAGWRLARLALPGDGGEALLLLHGPAADAGDAAETEQFSFTLSHDLRAPIRVVEGFTRIVKEDYGPLLDRVGVDHLDRVLGAAARMNQMIDALLTLARLSRQPLQRQPVNLSQIADWVAEELRRAAPQREVQFELEPGLQAFGDPTLLRLVLENLLGNAWKYSGRNERSVIRFARVPHDGASAYLVQDNGAGFDMRGADRLFGLFQRLHSASEFPGTGVGLASVRRIVQRHGGHIWAESEPGRGARFYFTLGPG